MNTKTKQQTKEISRTHLLTATLTVLLLVGAACGGGTPEYLGDGSLGTVEVAQGDSVQIRSVYTNPGDIALLGNSAERAIVYAVEDYGTIHGFRVDLGVGLDDMCSPEGGMITGSLVIAEGDVVGVVGTNCSAAAAEASPLITSAGMVLISPSNTAPSLTSDLAGTEGGSHFPGYYRTAHNDLIQGEAMAHFLYDKDVSTAAVVHDGGPYTEGLATAFSAAFEEHGGTITGTWEVERREEDLMPVLTEIAETSPDALFFPIFFPTGGVLVEQAAEMPAFSETVFAGADGLLGDDFPLAARERRHVHIRSQHTLRKQHQPEHRMERSGTRGPVSGSRWRTAHRHVLGACLRRHGPASRRHHRSLLPALWRQCPGDRPGRGTRVPRQPVRLPGSDRRPQLRRVRGLRRLPGGDPRTSRLHQHPGHQRERGLRGRTGRTSRLGSP